MTDGYPDEKELLLVREWPADDFISLMSFVESMWAYRGYRREIIKEYKSTIIEWTLTTAGWSGNESIISALLANRLFRMMWYYSWQRGGKYVFRINPKNVGYKIMSQFCKEKDFTRQYAYKIKDRLRLVELSKKRVFVKEK